MSRNVEPIPDVPEAESDSDEDLSSAEASGDEKVPAGPAAEDEETITKAKQQEELQKAITQAKKAARDAIKTLQPPMLDIADDDLEELCKSIRSLYCGDSDAKDPGPTPKTPLEPAVYETYRLIRDTLQNRRYESPRVQKAIEMINCTLKMSDAFGTGETSVPIEKLNDYIKSKNLKKTNYDPSGVVATGVTFDEKTATIHIMHYLSDPEQYDQEAYNEENKAHTKKYASWFFKTTVELQSLHTKVIALRDGGKISEEKANEFLSDGYKGLEQYCIDDKKRRRLEPEKRIQPLLELKESLEKKFEALPKPEGYLEWLKNQALSLSWNGFKQILKYLLRGLVYSVLAFGAINSIEDIQAIFFNGVTTGQAAADEKTFSVLTYLWYFYGNLIHIVGGPMQLLKKSLIDALTPLLQWGAGAVQWGAGAVSMFMSGWQIAVLLGILVATLYICWRSPATARSVALYPIKKALSTIKIIISALLKNIFAILGAGNSLATLIFTVAWVFSLYMRPGLMAMTALGQVAGAMGTPTFLTQMASWATAFFKATSMITYLVAISIINFIINRIGPISNGVRQGVIKFAQLIRTYNTKEDKAYSDRIRDLTDRFFFTRELKVRDYQHVDNLSALRLIDEIMNQTSNKALYGPLHNTLRQHKAFIIGKQTDAKLLPKLNNRILTAGLGQQPARIIQLMKNFGGHGQDKNDPKITPDEFYTIGLFMSTRVRTRAEHHNMLQYFTEAALDGHVDAMNYILMYYDEHPDVTPRGKKQYIQQLKDRHQEPPILQIGYLENEQRQLYRKQLTKTYDTMERKDIANAIVMLANNSQDYRILLLNETSPARLIKAILNALALEGNMMFTRVKVLSKTTPDDLLGKLQEFGSQDKIKFLNSIQDGKALLRHLHTELRNARTEENKEKKLKQRATLEAIFFATAGGLGQEFVDGRERLPEDEMNQHLRKVAFYMSNTESLYNMATYQGNGNDNLAFTSTSDVLGYFAAKGRIIARRMYAQTEEYEGFALKYYRAVGDVPIRG